MGLPLRFPALKEPLKPQDSAHLHKLKEVHMAGLSNRTWLTHTMHVLDESTYSCGTWIKRCQKSIVPGMSQNICLKYVPPFKSPPTKAHIWQVGYCQTVVNCSLKWSWMCWFVGGGGQGLSVNTCPYHVFPCRLPHVWTAYQLFISCLFHKMLIARKCLLQRN